MRFYRKHPYLIWQLIGWLIISAVVLYVVILSGNLQEDYQFVLVVLPTIVGLAIVTMSPLVLWVHRRDSAERERNKWIFLLATKSQKKAEAICTILSILIFFAATFCVALSGLFFLFPLGFYLAAAPYFLFRHITIKRFYKIPHAEQFCELYTITDVEALSFLEQQPALIYYNLRLDPGFLHFIYNFYASEGLLRQKTIHLIVVTPAILNNHYGLHLPEHSAPYLLITAEDLVFNRRLLSCYADHVDEYNHFIHQALFNQKMDDILLMLLCEHTGESHEILLGCLTDYQLDNNDKAYLIAVYDQIFQKAQHYCSKVRQNKMTVYAARQALNQQFPFLSIQKCAAVIKAVRQNLPTQI